MGMRNNRLLQQWNPGNAGMPSLGGMQSFSSGLPGRAPMFQPSQSFGAQGAPDAGQRPPMPQPFNPGLPGRAPVFQQPMPPQFQQQPMPGVMGAPSTVGAPVGAGMTRPPSQPMPPYMGNQRLPMPPQFQPPQYEDDFMRGGMGVGRQFY